MKYAQKTKNEDLSKLIGSDLVIKKAYDVLEQYNWTENELLAYEQEIKRVWDNRAVEKAMIEDAEAKEMSRGMRKGMAQGIEQGISQGIAQGMVQGIEKGALAEAEEIAANMLEENFPNNVISKVTGLSEYEITQLKKIMHIRNLHTYLDRTFFYIRVYPLNVDFLAIEFLQKSHDLA